jgi:hypothetical protein
VQVIWPTLPKKINRFIVSDYFDKLKELLMRLDITDKPEKMYNADGKGCRLRLNKESTVLGHKGEPKEFTLLPTSMGENISVVSYEN